MSATIRLAGLVIGVAALATAWFYFGREKPAEPQAAGVQAPLAPTNLVRFETTKGDILIRVHPDWAPLGAARFKKLVELGFYEDIAFFRIVPGFVVQFGIHGDPQVAATWRNRRLRDESVKQTNRRGTITYAKGGPNTRTTQLFINLVDNARLDGMGFPPFAEVVEGMDVVAQLHNVGQRPEQSRIQAEGNAYLRKEFPKIDFIKSARFEAEK